MTEKELTAWAIEQFLDSFEDRCIEHDIQDALRANHFNATEAINSISPHTGWLGGGGQQDDRRWNHWEGKHGHLAADCGDVSVIVPMKQVFMTIRDRMKIPGTLF